MSKDTGTGAAQDSGHRLSRRRLMSGAAGLGAVALSRPGGASGAARAARAQTADGGTIQLAWGWPDHLNTYIATSARQHDVMRRLHTRLIQWSKDLVAIQPELATEWAFSDNDTTMTFKLNPDAAWHDGQPLTSSDVIFTLSLAMHPGNSSRFRSLMSSVVGYDDYQNGAASVAGFEAPDAHTVVIKTTRPSPELWTAVLPMVAIMPEHILRDVEPDKLAEHPQMGFEPVGSGAYRFVSSEERQFIELERWEGFWGQMPAIGRIVGRVLDRPAQVALLEQGELHLAGSFHPNPADVERLRTIPQLVEYSQPGNIVNNLAVNVARPYLADKRIRQAISHAIDRQVIASAIMKDLFIPYQTHFGHPWLQPIENLTEYSYDVERARQLLAEAEYDTSRELDFVLSQEEPSDDLVVIQQMLEEAGFRIKFRAAPEPANTEERRSGNFDMWGGGGIGWETDPSAIFPMYGCGLEHPNGLNYQGYCNPEFDAAMQQGAATLNEDERRPHYWTAANILMEDLPQVFIMLRINTYFIHETLQGATPQGTSLPNDDGFADWTLVS